MNIFVVYVNSDQTEGRGPMVIDRAFAHQSVAMGYVEHQPDPWGRALDWNSRSDGTLVYGSYEIQSLKVDVSLSTEEFRLNDDAQKRAALLASLSPEQRRLLEL